MSTVKVNTVDKRTGGTLTLGGCGTTVTLGAGATQSGFGRTGTVDWCTTAKTAPFTGVSGNGYFVNTTCGAVTVTLPATPTAGDIISIADYASTWQTNSVTICRNSSKINGECANANLSTQGQSITLVYVDATRGWKNTMDSTSNVTGAAYVTATGGTVTTCGDYKIHAFTSDATFCVSNAGNPVGSTTVDYLVVAGGAGGAGNAGNLDGAGAGGAGGYRESSGTASGSYSVSPLGAGVSALPVTVTSYPITVGGGGTASAPTAGGVGSNSIFSTITSAGGGSGARSPGFGGNGGSGGGAVNCCSGGTGNTPPTSPPQGNPGGDGINSGSSGGGGGGGATVAGAQGTLSPLRGGTGGAGATTSISGSPTAYAGGGGGAGYVGGSNPAPNSGAPGGIGGGGSGGSNPPVPHTPFDGQNATANTGGGGGGAANSGSAQTGGTGGSGIVIVRYKFQN
jgi:hypothetical protein